MGAKENVRGQIRSQLQIKIPKKYHVLIYNDDFTPMDLVVEILVRIFDKQEQEAVALMLAIHKGSSAVAGVYPKDIAQTKAAEAVQWAREDGYPLKVEAVCR
ncbi:MAG: ATP-dependent Clp protease adaptor ClpS [Lachnospiraceae bacterium]|nr:ATP-dependent Clp protease adaptor ClpS [Lachnospiraceae bacterium]